MIDIGIYDVNTEEFRQPALHFLKHGKYTFAPKDSREYKEYWDLQEYFCLNGITVAGIKVTGEHYFYLNFCQIVLKRDELNTETTKSRIKQVKILTFPDFWDSDHYYFTECDIAKQEGQHMLVLKPRRRGYSYKNAAKCAYNYTFFRNSTSLIIAEQSNYSENNILMAASYLDFLSKNTDFGKTRIIDKPRSHLESGFNEILPDGKKVISGYRSKILAMTSRNNPEVARGQDANVILFEEAGSFSNLKATYLATLPTVQAGAGVSGIIYLFGCVCAGTKVWTNKGHLINIEDLKQEDGILGYDNNGINKEPITWIQPPAKKPCYRINTVQGTVLECSEDHPLFWSYNGFSYNKRITIDGKRISIKNTKKGMFKITKDIKVGEQVAVINVVPIFGEKVMWEPRLVGMLIGDGSYGFDKTPILSNCDNEINQYIDKNFNTKIEKSYITKDGRVYRETRIKEICPKLRELGIYGQTKLKKRLPVNIFDYDKRSLSELIAGLVDTDGYISKDSIVLTASSDILLTQIKEILIKFGVHSKIYRIDVSKYGNTDKKIKDVNDYFRLIISDYSSILSFGNNIELLIKYKQEALLKIIKNKVKGKDDVQTVFVKEREDNRNHVTTLDMNGLRFETIKSIEYIGEQNVYNLTAGDTHTYLANNIITHNTGGDVSAGIVDFQDMFYNPEPYNFRAFDNSWEEGMSNNQVGYFLPDCYSKDGFIDKNGNSRTKEALDFINAEVETVKRTSKDVNTIDKLLSENPRTPSEAFIKSSTNIFPKMEIQAQLNKIKGNSSLATLGAFGYMEQDDKGASLFKPSTDFKPILNFPYKSDVDGEGCVIQYQPPYKFGNVVPPELYYICVDPYALDKDKAKELTKRDSLGAAFVIKRVNNFSKPYDIIVAEYVARPKFQDDFNRQLFLLAKYYNAKIVFENDRDGNIISYARTQQLLHFLEVELTVYDAKDSPRKQLGRGYGVSMSNIEVKKQAVQYFRDWLLSPREKNEAGEFELNLHKIYSVPLLEECLRFNYDGNFDRISALLVGMLYKKELMLKPQVTQSEISVYDDPFFTDLKYKFGILS